MAYGQHGAEVLANVMRTVFTPLVRTVFEQGGFVTNFAGDAFTAVFPARDNNRDLASLNALAAAWQIQIHMADNAQQITRYGPFEFSAKVGVAAGETEWGTILSSDGRQAAYYFKGSAIDGCAEAQNAALSGDIIVDTAIFEAVELRVNAQRANDYWRVKNITATLPEPQLVNLPPLDIDQMALFSPRLLFEQETSGEFRQIFSLFISLQGMPQHEELDEFMQQLFSLQKQYGGVLNRIDFGDKGCHLLVFWGAPTSYENDLTRVLEFMLALRQESNIPLRAGITYRIAHAGCIGSSLAEEYTCYGRGVNLAARYMMAADWGEIWLDGEAAGRAETEFHLRSLGFKEFKGIAEPQAVYRLDGWRERAVSPFGVEPIVGRRQEIRQLREAIQPIYEGIFAGVMTVYGEAGIGKSRIVHAFLDETTGSKQTAVFICQTDEILRQSLNPFRYFLRRYFDQSASQDEIANKRGFDQILAGLLWSVADENLKAELERTQSFLGSLLGLHWEGSLYEQLEPELRFENTLGALKTLIKAESLNRPVIILVEDAHWLDKDSMQFLERLTRNVADYPLALLVTSRNELPESLFDADAPQHSLNLKSLGKENVAELAAAELGRKPSASLVQLLNERTDGNPFYVQQMLLYLLENELLETVDKQVGTTLPGDVYVPTDVRSLLTARLDRLPVAVKDVVQKAAVLGREFEVPILANMVNHDPQLAATLESGDKEEIWIALSEKRYLFNHALLRDAAYDMQLHSRLRQLHHLAANAFEEQMRQEPALEPRYAAIAYHFDRAEEADQARSYYSEAGDQAKDDYHNEEAVAYFSRGLELTTKADGQPQYRLLKGRETIYQWQGRREEQQKDLAQLATVLEDYPDDLKQADLALRQSSFALVTGDYETAVIMAQRSLKFAQKANDIVAKAKAYHRWGRTLWQQGKVIEAEEPIKKALDLVQGGEYREIEALCHYDLNAVYFGQANFSQADVHLKLAEQAYERFGDKQGLVTCLNAHGVISYARANYSRAIMYYEQAIELCRQIGWRYVEPRYLSNIGNNYFDLGNYELAQAYHDQSLAICREIDNLEIEAISLDTLGLIAHYQDRLLEAIEYYQKALAVHEVIGNQKERAFALTHLGYVSVELNQLKEAKLILEEALKIRRELGAEALAIDTVAGLALLNLKVNNLEKAQHYAAHILSWIEVNGTDGIELPVLVYLICYRVIQAAAKEDSSLLKDARGVLDEGHDLLEQHALRIQDSDLRQRFMENVPYNHLLQSAWLENQ